METRIVMHRINGGKGIVSFEVPAEPEVQETLRNILRTCRDKYNDYVSVSFKPPYKPRTTGAHSQNHHLNGHIMQICAETQNDYETIKYCVKMIAVERLGYSYEQFGKYIVPKGERDCDTEEESKLIEAAHILAAEIGIILREAE